VTDAKCDAPESPPWAMIEPLLDPDWSTNGDYALDDTSRLV
jgi:hypothetical protein